MTDMPKLSIALRVLSRLLAYPNSDLCADLPDLRTALHAENALTATRKEELYSLIRKLETGDPLENESEFVDLFDRGRATSLHLFEHVHGDSRDRGPAMIDLLQTYEKAGLLLAPQELPDYLPVVLEFVSTQPPKEARAFLGEIAHIVAAIHGALLQRKSAYACVLATLLELSGEAPAMTEITPIAPDESLDACWEEPPVFGDCSTKWQAGSQAVESVHFVDTGALAGKTAISASKGAIR